MYDYDNISILIFSFKDFLLNLVVIFGIKEFYKMLEKLKFKNCEIDFEFIKSILMEKN